MHSLKNHLGMIFCCKNALTKKSKSLFKYSKNNPLTALQCLLLVLRAGYKATLQLPVLLTLEAHGRIGVLVTAEIEINAVIIHGNRD